MHAVEAPALIARAQLAVLLTKLLNAGDNDCLPVFCLGTEFFPLGVFPMEIGSSVCFFAFLRTNIFSGQWLGAYRLVV